ncbi:hypothetical protein GXP70_24260 [Paenibacillus lycopersici]|uniref:Uncharacterized protein n=1 Tax=Paenibacillus lycopersici TaxID=2704462 RepID=A0A6C0G1U5_9BACL|nr:hypothetical protein [Paenibacillus lycopersici]QHT62787.1 hypothetical protein GXP70_24260 [Paenibacillus lycopersici]
MIGHWRKGWHADGGHVCRRARLSIWRREDGAVSLYLIVATAAMLLFTSLLIDYARIAAFNRQSELAAQSGIRSALSAYDEKLYEQYGLFGAGGTDRSELFAEAAENNWPDESGNGFRLLRIKREASHVDIQEVLGNQTVFTRQVLEEMKYKAPIDFTMEIASRFAPIGTAMKEASATIGVLEDVRKLYEERERHLERIAGLQSKSAASASKLDGALQNVSSIVSGYGAYASWRQADASRGEDEEPKHAGEIAAYASRASSDAASAKADAEAGMENHSSNTQEALAELQAAEACNASIASAVERMRASQDLSGFDQLADANIAGRESSSMTGNELSDYEATRSSVDELVLDEGWFNAYRAELNEQLTLFGQVDTAAASFQAAVLSALGSNGGGAALDGALSGLSTSVGNYSSRYLNPGTVIQDRQVELERRHAHDGERRAKEAAAKSKWDEVKSMLGGMTSAPGQDEWKQAFDDVRRLADDNLRFNQAAAETEAGENEAGENEEGGADNPGNEAASAMTSMGAMFGGMSDLLEGIRDPLYVNEYVVHRFGSFDLKRLQGVISGSGDNSSFSESLALENQEVEYILYGFGEPAANIAAAVGEIFAARLAIRTMEGFVECRALGHPLLVLAAAVLYGLEKAVADLVTLSETGKVQLSKYVPAELTYADYLRVFLIMHGSGGQARTARMIAVIEHDTGADLSLAATGLSGEMTSSVNLWFLPGLMRSFTAAGILNGKVKDGRYERTQTIGSSYG